MKQILLTRGQFALVDDEDYERLNQHKWHAHYDPIFKGYYAVTDVGGRKQKRRLYMHRVVLNAPAGTHVDHRNHDSLDNRRSNLRRCTASENHANTVMRADNSSGYKGVTWCKKSSKWKAQLGYQGTNINIGEYTSARNAAMAYDNAALNYFGEFALTNEAMGLLERSSDIETLFDRLNEDAPALACESITQRESHYTLTSISLVKENDNVNG